MLEAFRWIHLDIAPSGTDTEKASELVASKRLVRLFNRIGLVWTEPLYDDSAEVVIVRGRDDFLDERFTLPTPETAAVKLMRAEVHDINRWTLRHAIFLFLPDSVVTGLIRCKEKMFVNLYNITYRRIFVR